MSLRKQQTLLFKRPTAGYLDSATRKWVEGTPVDIEAIGNLQPFRTGANQNILPDGLTTNDARLFYTNVELKPSNQFNDTNADYVDINGLEFEVFTSEDWTTTNLSLRHYKVLLIRRDKNPNGGS